MVRGPTRLISTKGLSTLPFVGKGKQVIVPLFFGKYFGRVRLVTTCFLQQGGDIPEFEAVVILGFTVRVVVGIHEKNYDKKSGEQLHLNDLKFTDNR
jgi:hypothetical protein